MEGKEENAHLCYLRRPKHSSRHPSEDPGIPGPLQSLLGQLAIAGSAIVSKGRAARRSSQPIYELDGREVAEIDFQHLQLSFSMHGHLNIDSAGSRAEIV